MASDLQGPSYAQPGRHQTGALATVQASLALLRQCLSASGQNHAHQGADVSVLQIELPLSRADDLRDVGAVRAAVCDDTDRPVRATFLRRHSDHAASVHIRLLASKARQGFDALNQHLLQLLGGEGGFPISQFCNARCRQLYRRRPSLPRCLGRGDNHGRGFNKPASDFLRGRAGGNFRKPSLVAACGIVRGVIADRYA